MGCRDHFCRADLGSCRHLLRFREFRRLHTQRVLLGLQRRFRHLQIDRRTLSVVDCGATLRGGLLQPPAFLFEVDLDPPALVLLVL
jgi:hypothetical protein